MPDASANWTRDIASIVTKDWNVESIAILCEKPHRFVNLIEAAIGHAHSLPKIHTKNVHDHLAYVRCMIRDPSSPPPQG